MQPDPTVTSPAASGGDPLGSAAYYQDVRTRRALAFLLDVVVVGALCLGAGFLVLLLGLFTFGLGWFIYPILWQVVALVYAAITLGGPRSATIGMRSAGLELRMWNGGRPDALIGAMHTLLYWFSVTLLTPLVLAVCLFTPRKQLLHDLILGTVVINSAVTYRDSGRH
ncbi:RDD family protein [Stappia indica]|uniref:RDD family protein n=1 Tax=Stappia indica TaxID=538381 RepID=UPI001CD579F7|nr:RDD family protein [Stappia indica]MCA1297233.1 RDD family protein [Stappia indica]